MFQHAIQHAPTGGLAFVTGTGRCGSTLVAEVVARHPEVGFISNVDDKLSTLNLPGRGNGPLYRLMGPRDPALPALRDRRALLEKSRLRVRPSEGWNLFDRHVMSNFSSPCRDLVATDATPYVSARLRAFFDARLETQRCGLLVQHLTGWPRAGLLGAVYPDARIVNVVRDGRAVANSWLQMGWWDGYRGPGHWYLGELDQRQTALWEQSNRSFPVLAGLGWMLLMDSFDAARNAFRAEQWLDVRYEDVLADPRRTFGRVLDFLGLDWSAEFESGFRRHRFEPARRVAFRRDLDAASLTAMEAVMGDQLRAWGYAVSRQRAGSPVAVAPVALA